MAASLNQIKDRDAAWNIQEITNCFVKQIHPVKVFLFGSFADGSYDEDSDYDFYIVVKDSDDPWDTRKRARRAIRYIQKRPVDIVVGTDAHFRKYGASADTLFIEEKCFRKVFSYMTKDTRHPLKSLPTQFFHELFYGGLAYSQLVMGTGQLRDFKWSLRASKASCKRLSKLSGA